MKALKIPVMRGLMTWRDKVGSAIICYDFVDRYIGVPDFVERAILYIIPDKQGNLEIRKEELYCDITHFSWRFAEGGRWDALSYGLKDRLLTMPAGIERVSVYMEYYTLPIL